jgi:hypothetical protein
VGRLVKSSAARERPDPSDGHAGAAISIPPTALEEQVSAPPTVGEYARLAWFAASIATVGGALGSLDERDEAVRDAAYRPRGGRQETSAAR